MVDLVGRADAAGASDLTAMPVALEDAAVVGLALPAGLAEALAMARAPWHLPTRVRLGLGFGLLAVGLLAVVGFVAIVGLVGVRLVGDVAHGSASGHAKAHLSRRGWWALVVSEGYSPDF